MYLLNIIITQQDEARFIYMLGTRCPPLNLAALMNSFQRRLVSVGDGGSSQHSEAHLLVHNGSPERQSELWPESRSRDRPGSEMKKYWCWSSKWEFGKGGGFFVPSNICKQDHWMSFHRVLGQLLTSQPSSLPASIMQTLAFRRLFQGARWRTIPPVAREGTHLPINTTVWCISSAACSSWWWRFRRGFTGSLRLKIMEHYSLW